MRTWFRRDGKEFNIANLRKRLNIEQLRTESQSDFSYLDTKFSQGGRSGQSGKMYMSKVTSPQLFNDM